jgi:hypothetical protein
MGVVLTCTSEMRKAQTLSTETEKKRELGRLSPRWKVYYNVS